MKQFKKSLYTTFLANRVLLYIPTMTVRPVVQSMQAGSTSLLFRPSERSRVCLTSGSLFGNIGSRWCGFICPTTITNNSGPVLSDGLSPSARLSIGPAQWPAAQLAGKVLAWFYLFQQATRSTPTITRDTHVTNSSTSRC